jgi:glycerol dehydrogenase
VLVDTAVIAKAPVRLLISGMGDALATRFEAEAVRGAHKANVVGGASSIAAAALADLCYQTLLRDGVVAVAAAKTGAITPAFERIVEANTLLSGLGFESGGLAVAHSVHNGLTAAPETHDRLHGEKVAFGLMTQLCLDDDITPDERNEVVDFMIEVGLPVTFAEIGMDKVSREELMDVAVKLTAEGNFVHNHVFPVKAYDFFSAMIAADALGKSRKAL